MHLHRLCHLPQRKQQLSDPSLCVTGVTWLLGFGLKMPCTAIFSKSTSLSKSGKAKA